MGGTLRKGLVREITCKPAKLHKGEKSNQDFIKRFIERHGGKVTGMFPMKMDSPRLFEFHTKRKHTLQVDLYRIEGKAYESV